MMDISTQIMCELQSEVFAESISRYGASSLYFIMRYMNSEVTKNMDNKNDYYNYYSKAYIFSELEKEYPSLLTKKEGNKIPLPVMKWIGYIYRAWSYLQDKDSSRLYKFLKAERLVSLYNTYHTFGIDYCIERLEELVEQDRPQMSDFERFKEIKLRLSK